MGLADPEPVPSIVLPEPLFHLSDPWPPLPRRHSWRNHLRTWRFLTQHRDSWRRHLPTDSPDPGMQSAVEGWVHAVREAAACERWAAPVFGPHDASENAVSEDIRRHASQAAELLLSDLVWLVWPPSWTSTSRQCFAACRKAHVDAAAAHARFVSERDFQHSRSTSQERNETRAEFERLGMNATMSFDDYFAEVWCAPHRSAFMTARPLRLLGQFGSGMRVLRLDGDDSRVVAGGGVTVGGGPNATHRGTGGAGLPGFVPLNASTPAPAPLV